MPFTIGETVGQYRITEQLGHGGMATVYRAYHAKLNRYVAIKVLHAALKADPGFSDRFTREAQIVAQLEHPNIVPIYDFAEHNGEPYLVMKFIEGMTLKARMDSAPLTLDEAIRILSATGAALTYAHERDVLHRDIKPSNILIDKGGEPYLADFGLARMASAGESTLSQDMLLGTPQYISPEQAQGSRTLDAGTDIYALGVVIYELVVGRVPFQADTPYAIIHNHIYAPMPMPTSVNPAVPRDVEQVLLKALAKDRADRQASAVELANAFYEAVAGLDAATRLPFSGATKAARPATVAAPAASGASLSNASGAKASAAIPSPRGSTASPSPTVQKQRAASPPPTKPARSGGLLLGALAVLAVGVIALVGLLLINRGRGGTMIPTSAAVALAGSNTAVSTAGGMASLPTRTPAPPSATATLRPTITLRPTLTPRPSNTPRPMIQPPPPGTRIAIRPGTGGGFEALLNAPEPQIRAYIDANPNDPIGHFALAVTLSRGNNSATTVREADAAFRKALALVKDDPALMTQMMQRLTAINPRHDNTIQFGMETALSAHLYALRAEEDRAIREHTGETMFQYAVSAEQAPARVEVLATLAKDTDNSVVYAMWALAAQLAGDRAGASQAMRNALQGSRDIPEVKLVEGILFKAQNRPVQARAALRAASRPEAPAWVREAAKQAQQGI